MRNEIISTEQQLRNKINATSEFTYPNLDLIKGEPKRRFKGLNPSLGYTEVFEDIAFVKTHPNTHLVGVKHLDGTYEVLLYADWKNDVVNVIIDINF